MSVNIVLPTLSSWAGSRLKSILGSKTQTDFNTAFDATFAAACKFVLNGKPSTRDAYKAQLQQDSAAGFGENSTTVQIEQTTQVETGNQGQLSGLVGIFYTSTSESKFLVLGAPSQKKATSSINVEIEPTEKSPQTNPRIRGYFDPRRVTSVNQVVAESTLHVTIPTSSVPTAKATATTAEQSSKVELGPEALKLPEGRFLHLPASETGAEPETLPGFGMFGVGPVIAPGETIGESKQ